MGQGWGLANRNKAATGFLGYEFVSVEAEFAALVLRAAGLLMSGAATELMVPIAFLCLSPALQLLWRLCETAVLLGP